MIVTVFLNVVVTDPCLPNPCLNDGECINEDGKAACKCKGRFIGQYCESKIFIRAYLTLITDQ